MSAYIPKRGDKVRITVAHYPELPVGTEGTVTHTHENEGEPERIWVLVEGGPSHPVASMLAGFDLGMPYMAEQVEAVT